jgi:SAM-dependent methyltransferase
MSKLKLGDAYRQFVKSLGQTHDHDKAMQVAIGGEFDAVGIIEREILIHHGLTPSGSVIDVGCGSGRLSKPLSQYLQGSYVGIDIVPELVAHAKALTARPDWTFAVAAGLAIPADAECADIVCFFSVFTHLLHEQSYVYLQEAKRVLKPGGRIVFSFLEFAMPSHWTVFENTVANMGPDHLNVFIGRDAIAAWAAHLELEILAIVDGDKPQTPLREPVTMEDGTVLTDSASLGQSLCVLRKH